MARARGPRRREVREHRSSPAGRWAATGTVLGLGSARCLDRLAKHAAEPQEWPLQATLDFLIEHQALDLLLEHCPEATPPRAFKDKEARGIRISHPPPDTATTPISDFETVHPDEPKSVTRLGLTVLVERLAFLPDNQQPDLVGIQGLVQRDRSELVWNPTAKAARPVK
ncbi:hypothetical protein OG401_00300 [Kitasatospora purpeofusca]|uniref:hypothetical protein n=1 Tax=Kitasatospora purpeofusca TaxID=67352 RepID=UPI00225563D7|nr:hypothetical protein [Kitasatospora purpeofusca]MCX4682764.1 hypothetical protein [Kitasatospora purpeofusca]